MSGAYPSLVCEDAPHPQVGEERLSRRGQFRAIRAVVGSAVASQSPFPKPPFIIVVSGTKWIRVPSLTA
jgi:hypothetical protein